MSAASLLGVLCECATEISEQRMGSGTPPALLPVAAAIPTLASLDDEQFIPPRMPTRTSRQQNDEPTSIPPRSPAFRATTPPPSAKLPPDGSQLMSTSSAPGSGSKRGAPSASSHGRVSSPVPPVAPPVAAPPPLPAAVSRQHPSRRTQKQNLVIQASRQMKSKKAASAITVEKRPATSGIKRFFTPPIAAAVPTAVASSASSTLKPTVTPKFKLPVEPAVPKTFFADRMDAIFNDWNLLQRTADAVAGIYLPPGNGRLRDALVGNKTLMALRAKTLLLEEQIFKLESKYLADLGEDPSLINGWEGYLKLTAQDTGPGSSSSNAGITTANAGGGNRGTKRGRESMAAPPKRSMSSSNAKKLKSSMSGSVRPVRAVSSSVIAAGEAIPIHDEQRLFSASSVTSAAAITALQSGQVFASIHNTPSVGLSSSSSSSSSSSMETPIRSERKKPGSGVSSSEGADSKAIGKLRKLPKNNTEAPNEKSNPSTSLTSVPVPPSPSPSVESASDRYVRRCLKRAKDAELEEQQIVNAAVLATVSATDTTTSNGEGGNQDGTMHTKENPVDQLSGNGSSPPLEGNGGKPLGPQRQLVLDGWLLGPKPPT